MSSGITALPVTSTFSIGLPPGFPSSSMSLLSVDAQPFTSSIQAIGQRSSQQSLFNSQQDNILVQFILYVVTAQESLPIRLTSKFGLVQEPLSVVPSCFAIRSKVPHTSCPWVLAMSRVLRPSRLMVRSKNPYLSVPP